MARWPEGGSRQSLALPIRAGERRGGRGEGGADGSVPAHAGEYWRSGAVRRDRQAYPRAHGGTQAWLDGSFFDWGLSPRMWGAIRDLALRILAQGLSPRMRGNPVGPSRCGHREGPIPRMQGSPSTLTEISFLGGAYSRACGGTIGRAGAILIPGGAIPTHAGEPCDPRPARCRPGVYPRACGGTYLRRVMTRLGPGLSPRIRGNLSQLTH